MILMWAGTFWWKSALLIADAISWSILLGSGTLSSLLKIKPLSAILDPDVGAGAGPARAFLLWVWGGTVSHLLAAVGSDLGLMLATVPDHHFGSGSGSKPNRCQIGGPGRQ